MQTYLVKFLSILTLFSCGAEYKSSEPEKSVNLNIQPVADPNDSGRRPNFQPNRPRQPSLGLRPEQLGTKGRRAHQRPIFENLSLHVSTQSK